jgi:predicted nucleic acid-binding protein
VIVVDTNVISELMRPDPDLTVIAWVSGQPLGSLATTAINVAEIRVGLARLSDGARKVALSAAAEGVFSGLKELIWSFDAHSAQEYATVVAHRESIGRPISGFDAQIAAVCISRGAAIATRNVDDFSDLGLEVIDPWQSRQPR